ncbi:helix-turn-helix domain-containing protein [Paraclostridium bifermentans]|uniref:helix-turn-helix domain-containing protein n=1 Tax=Paraclostridium bifermentans TaxID=1490 RepID=UPI00214A23C5|nr:helix-turn-helix transcriptional regulator [Paraclostridium bifermentans]MCR1876439.1 helix-turn-helix domain-containing protein [Paraclostridium bifermentans]
MSIGNNIKKIRNLKGLKQSELAELSDVSRVAIGNYERGERTPNVDILNKIANALDVSITDLLSEDTNNDKSKVVVDLSDKDKLDESYFKLRALSRDKELMNEILSRKIEDVGYFEKLILSIYNNDRIKDFNIDVATEICNLLNSDVMQKELNYSFTDILNDEAYFALMISSIIGTIENNLTFIKNSDKSKKEANKE